MEPYTIVFSMLIFLIGTIGFIGNLVVIIVYVSDKALRSYTNYFFVNLSITDILIILICLPVAIHDMTSGGAWNLGHFICYSEHFIEGILTSVSSLTLISISVERFLAISQPLHVHKLVNKKKTIIVILFLWVISAISSAPHLYITAYGSQYMSNESNETIDYCFTNRTAPYSKTYIAAFTSVFIFAPTVVLSFVYSIIIRNIKRLNRRYSNTTGLVTFKKSKLAIDTSSNISYNMKVQAQNKRVSNSEKDSSNECVETITTSLNQSKSRKFSTFTTRHNINSKFNVDEARKESGKQNRTPRYSYNLVAKRKQTITLCLISLAFFFCQIPIRLFQIFNTFYIFPLDGEDDMVKFKYLNALFLLSKMLYFLHGTSNPIIYNLMSTKFSNSFKSVIFCKSFKLCKYLTSRSLSSSRNHKNDACNHENRQNYQVVHCHFIKNNLNHNQNQNQNTNGAPIRPLLTLNDLA